MRVDAGGPSRAHVHTAGAACGLCWPRSSQPRACGLQGPPPPHAQPRSPGASGGQAARIQLRLPSQTTLSPGLPRLHQCGGLSGGTEDGGQGTGCTPLRRRSPAAQLRRGTAPPPAFSAQKVTPGVPQQHRTRSQESCLTPQACVSAHRWAGERTEVPMVRLEPRPRLTVLPPTPGVLAGTKGPPPASRVTGRRGWGGGRAPGRIS